MSELRKANTDHCYFLTLTVAGWINVFTRDIYTDIIYENLEYCRKNKGLEIYAYVIMSNHIHLIAGKKMENLVIGCEILKVILQKKYYQQLMKIKTKVEKIG